MKDNFMKWLFLIFLLILIPSVLSMRTCLDIIEPNTDCMVITPVVTCATYDLYNSTLNLTIDEGAMSQVRTTGTYNFTFNQPDLGAHKIILCDNTTADLEVAYSSNKMIYDNNLANSSSIRSDLSIAQNGIQNNRTSTENKINTLANITVSQIDLQLNSSHSKGNWSNTLNGWATSSQAGSILSGIQSNRTYSETNLSVVLGNLTVVTNLINALNDIAATDVWSSVTRTLTSFGTLASDIDLQLNNSHSKGNWSNTQTATISSADKIEIAQLTDGMINNSHSAGNYSNTQTATATISASDKSDIANQTFYKLIQNKTETYFNNSQGYPTYEIWTYSDVLVNKSYSYWTGNLTIKNSSFKRLP